MPFSMSDRMELQVSAGWSSRPSLSPFHCSRLRPTKGSNAFRNRLRWIRSEWKAVLASYMVSAGLRHESLQ